MLLYKYSSVQLRFYISRYFQVEEDGVQEGWF